MLLFSLIASARLPSCCCTIDVDIATMTPPLSSASAAAAALVSLPHQIHPVHRVCLSQCGAVTREDVAAVVIKALLSDKADSKVRRQEGGGVQEGGRDKGGSSCCCGQGSNGRMGQYSTTDRGC